MPLKVRCPGFSRFIKAMVLEALAIEKQLKIQARNARLC